MRSRLALVLTFVLLAGTLSACAASPAAGPDTASTVESGSVEPTAAASTGSMKGSNPDPAALLPLEAVRRVTGMRDLRLVEPNSTPEAVGRLNFATNGRLVLIMNIGDAVAFDESRDGMFYGEDLEGIGDDAFVGPSDKVSAVRSIVAVKKGDHAVILRTFGEGGSGAAPLSIDQLRQLAEIVLGSWG